jgi:phenylalanyl-tRNA synthetase beta subunit
LIPPTRSDIIHACDIWEDAAIGFVRPFSR